MKKKLVLFILTLALWFVFAGRINIEVFLLGTIICSIIALMMADIVFGSVQMKFGMKGLFIKAYYILLVICAHIFDVFLSAVRVSIQAFAIKPSFSPRIERVKTSHKNGSSTAISVNFITIPQGSLAMDIDISTKNYTIHWIDVHSDNEAETKKAVIHKHEKLIAKIVD
ncbi:Na+/H+ antiporter subunit E [Bacillus luteolus]|uniref:Na+/H+ antiporter subunit E n=1 Tax=Litchfieldia luteola TaxID=682179 RepID=A0ABR9QDE8_9BACI|nr:Na+/H+ antiporter subunit E [Cytobacillus luteolus]MBE4906491.1 Na+/H+ antiporter subunit E [Cytobacillus luteolus]MBP1941174.1 multicomponent Na+:H+ antiporter subunit E [Cytobacillus luteolus]